MNIYQAIVVLSDGATHTEQVSAIDLVEAKLKVFLRQNDGITSAVTSISVSIVNRYAIGSVTDTYIA